MGTPLARRPRSRTAHQVRCIHVEGVRDAPDPLQRWGLLSGQDVPEVRARYARAIRQVRERDVPLVRNFADAADHPALQLVHAEGPYGPLAVA